MPIYIPPASSAVDIIQWAIIDRNGTEHDLTWNTSNQIFVPRGTKGLALAPTDLVLDKLPFSAGSKLRYIKTQPLEIDLPLVINKSSLISAMTSAEEIRNWFFTGDERNKTPAYLKITRPQDNEARQIAVYYNGGLEGDLEDGSPTYIPYIIKLLAPDPMWTAAQPTELAYDSSDVNVDQFVPNPGDVDAYPIWVIGGPITNPSITNYTSGKFFSFTNSGGLTISAGGFIIVDTRPQFERTTLPVLDQDGTSQHAKLTVTSSLETWLLPGSNQMRIGGFGTSGSTTVSLSYTPRYRGVLR